MDNLSDLQLYESAKMEFNKFPKIKRLHKDVVVTEKIDGTNATIFVSRHKVDGSIGDFTAEALKHYILIRDGDEWVMIKAGSRNRWLSKDSDNFGFFDWVESNKKILMNLRPGWHRGEWFGLGIQHGYGLDEKRFALFNPLEFSHKYYDYGENRETLDPKLLRLNSLVKTVPIIEIGPISVVVPKALHLLESEGSVMVPGQKAEGIIIYHPEAKVYFKETFEYSEGKWAEK